MSKPYVYLVHFTVDKEESFGLWTERDEGDVFLKSKEAHEPISFKSKNEAIDFSNKNELTISSDNVLQINLTNLERIINPIEAHKRINFNSKECSEILDFFNISQDLLRSLNVSLHVNDNLNEILIKLFSGANIPPTGGNSNGVSLNGDDGVILKSYFFQYQKYVRMAFLK